MSPFLFHVAPGDFAEKHVLKLVEWFSGHCRAIKSQNLPQSRLQVVQFAAFWSRCKILACEVWACAESKISRQFLGLKVTQQCWLFLFAFSSPLFFCFTCLIFFSLAGYLVGFILVGKVFRKAFRIFGLDERKGRWVVEQDFHANFQVNVTWFFAFFYGVLDWIVLILVWFDRVVKGAGCRRKSAPKSLVSTLLGISLWMVFLK